MIIPNIWENKKCSKPPTRSSFHRCSWMFIWVWVSFSILSRKETVLFAAAKSSRRCDRSAPLEEGVHVFVERLHGLGFDKKTGGLAMRSLTQRSCRCSTNTWDIIGIYDNLSRTDSLGKSIQNRFIKKCLSP